MSRELQKVDIKRPLQQSIADWAFDTVKKELTRRDGVMRDKMRTVTRFFSLHGQKQPDKITTRDVRAWHRFLLDKNLSENYIYAQFSQLAGYFDWLVKINPEFARFIKTNPVRSVMPSPPKKYNSPKVKALSDEELSNLWLYLENLAGDDDNLTAVRDYVIFRFFMATGMRREEIIGIGARDVRIVDNRILIHTKIKGGIYDWRTIEDDDVTAALERYLKLTRRRSKIGQPGAALWIRFDRAAAAAGLDRKAEDPSADEPRLSGHGFDKQMKKYAAEAGIGNFNLHRFRHTFARIVAEDSGSLIETQDALGHSDIQTTRVYVQSITFKKDKFSRNIRNRIKPGLPEEEEGQPR